MRLCTRSGRSSGNGRPPFSMTASSAARIVSTIVPDRSGLFGGVGGALGGVGNMFGSWNTPGNSFVGNNREDPTLEFDSPDPMGKAAVWICEQTPPQYTGNIVRDMEIVEANKL